MDLFGFKVKKDEKFTDIKKEYNQILQKANEWKNSIKPFAEDRFFQSAADDKALIPIFPLSEKYIYDLALVSDVLRTGLNAKKSGIFRRGLKYESIFETPDPQQEERLKALIKSCNNNKQSLIEMSKTVQFDADALDNGYFLFLKDYYFNFY